MARTVSIAMIENRAKRAHYRREIRKQRKKDDGATHSITIWEKDGEGFPIRRCMDGRRWDELKLPSNPPAILTPNFCNSSSSSVQSSQSGWSKRITSLTLVFFVVSFLPLLTGGRGEARGWSVFKGRTHSPFFLFIYPYFPPGFLAWGGGGGVRERCEGVCHSFPIRQCFTDILILIFHLFPVSS